MSIDRTYFVWRLNTSKAYRPYGGPVPPADNGELLARGLTYPEARERAKLANIPVRVARRRAKIRIRREMVAREDWRSVHNQLRGYVAKMPVSGFPLVELYRDVRQENGRATMWVTLNDVYETCRALGCRIEGAKPPHCSYVPTGTEIIYPPPPAKKETVA